MITLMLIAVGCFTICALSDKYAVTTAKFNGTEFAFLMAASTAVFMAFCLPFIDCSMTFTWQAALSVILITAAKIAEFVLSAAVLKEISAFELRAWLGIPLFLSYIADIFYGEVGSVIRFALIGVTIIGLIMIAKSGRKANINYKKIILPLIFYLLEKFLYGIIVREGTPYISANLMLFFALILMSLILLPKAKPIEIFRKNKKGAWVVILTKIPNVAGLLAENAIIAKSIVNDSFINPCILCVLFIIGFIRRESVTKLSVAGSLVCIAGVVGFQIAGVL